ncbi:tripartite motif-containing protein 59-like isoform X2 [Ruditapes philippinarum]|uniref:tripartite motif-containing protein 59-like isoform X2 n=1 Tax=Ruditapes philippinarum TaxID=129788 RepID=UPI00295BC8BF|nr:tripartite motif-containing protein 59-like isoform X2 [Ruditapes philippinarum]
MKMSGLYEKLLNCPFCKEGFKGDPKLLPCLHSVCESPCLKKILGSQPSRCPRCSQELKLSSDTEDIPTDMVLNSLVSHYCEYKTLPLNPAEFSSDEYIDLKERGATSGSPTNNNVVDVDTVQVRRLIVESISLIHDSIKRLEEILKKTDMIRQYNQSVAENGDLKRLYQTFEQKHIDIKEYLESVANYLASFTDNNIHLRQCEEHLSTLLEIEFSELIFDVKREFEKHSPKKKRSHVSLPLDCNTLSPSQQREVTGRTAPRQMQPSRIQDSRRSQSANSSNDRRGFYSKLAVCSFTNVMVCLRLGIGIWNIAQHGSTLVIIAASFLILKAISETCCIYWLVIYRSEGDRNSRQYICLVAMLVLFGIFCILDIGLAYITGENVNLPLRVLRVITIVDIVWNLVILLTIKLLAKRCFRH